MKQKEKRGYMLMEVMISGAILAVMLGTTFSIIADARSQITYTARQASAIALCRQKIEELGTLSTLPGPIPSQATVLVDPTGVTFTGLSWNWDIIDRTGFYAGKVPTYGMVAGKALWDIRVAVIYPTRTGTKTYTLETLKER